MWRWGDDFWGPKAKSLSESPKMPKATPHNSRLTAQAPLRRLRHGICVAKMLDNVGLRYPHRASGAKAPRTLRPLPLLRFAVSATGSAHLCSIQYYLRFWLGICRTSLAVSALRIVRCCPRPLRDVEDAVPYIYFHDSSQIYFAPFPPPYPPPFPAPIPNF